MKKIQAIVKVDGEITYYLYDDDITTIINNWVKLKLPDTRKDAEVTAEMNAPPLTYDELKDQ